MHTRLQWPAWITAGALTALLIQPSYAAASRAVSRAQGSECRTLAAQLRERLEAVTEAFIDGRYSDVAPAADRAQKWWLTHRPASADSLAGDSLLRSIATAGRSSRPAGAALSAVALSVRSFDWCGGPVTPQDDLMRLDLAGAVGWLRANGESADWPAGLAEATDRVVARLEQKKRGDLAYRLRAATSALRAVPDQTAGSTRPAGDLLDLVDELEKALR